ncbi:MAG: PadR family transcriptional regulator [Bilophila wadsworthia]
MMELDNCPCSGANLPRFVQPVILAVLSSGPLHGYLVVQRLAETSLFRKQPPDATGVYRMLRNMEQEGVLESDWELENSGPARKRYTLTEKANCRPMDARGNASGSSPALFCGMRAQA